MPLQRWSFAAPLAATLLLLYVPPCFSLRKLVRIHAFSGRHLDNKNIYIGTFFSFDMVFSLGFFGGAAAAAAAEGSAARRRGRFPRRNRSSSTAWSSTSSASRCLHIIYSERKRRLSVSYYVVGLFVSCREGRLVLYFTATRAACVRSLRVNKVCQHLLCIHLHGSAPHCPCACLPNYNAADVVLFR